MRTRLVLGIALLLRVTHAAAETSPSAARPAVVIELFTSQGCSSCPPADELLTRLGADPTLGAQLVPLAFHVDYWNHIGWTDPFSQAAWTERQVTYGRALDTDSAYTPQLVVNGHVQFVGSQEARARQAIAAELAQGAPVVQVTLSVSRADERTLVAGVSAAVLAPLAARHLDVLVALFENGLTTQVARGENGGRALHDDFVVRRLDKAGSLAPQPGERVERTLRLPAPREAKRLGVAAFVQDPQTMRIHAAVRADAPAR